jgi:hypothetical protein
VFAATLSVLAVTAAPALAAAPEAPELTVQQPVHATEATFLGILEPKATEPAEAGTYEFLYKASKTKECEGGLAAGGISFGAPHEELPGETVTGLAPGTEYAVCLQIETAGGKATSTPAVTFLTATPPEAPEASTAEEVTATTAKLEATINPHREAVTGYELAYSDTGKCTEGATTEPVAPAKLKSPTKVTVPLTSLEPSKDYEACLIASNEAGETASGAEVPFTTLDTPAKIESEAASNIKASEATLEGSVNPNNQLTECHFQYGTGAVTENEVACTPELLKGFGVQEVNPRALNEKGEMLPAPIGGLTPGSEYHYRILTKNGKHEVGAGPENTFRTAEAPEVLKAEPVTAREATLKGVLQPHNPFEAGTYEFVYEQSAGECMGAPGPKGELPYKTVPAPAAATAGTSPEPESAAITGLHPGDSYTYCLLLRNAAGNQAAISAQETFTTPAAAPVIASESVSHIEETKVTLEAQIEADGAATEYSFEYGPTESYGPPTKLTVLPEGGKVAVLIPETGTLTPGGSYHYRVTATNTVEGATETVHGEDKPFTTLEPPPTTPETCPNAARRAEQPDAKDLPDCRAYEMVSPRNTDGQDATAETEFREASPRASEAKEAEPAVAYTSLGSFAAPHGSMLENEYVSRRAASGWGTQAIDPLSDPTEFGREPVEGNYRGALLTPELTAGVALTSGKLVEEAPPMEYGHWGTYVATFASGRYQYLGQLVGFGDAPWGASTDLTRVVLPVVAENAETGSLVEYVDKSEIQLSVTNTEAPLSFLLTGDRWHAVSENGSRAYFTVSEGSTAQLYGRVNIGESQNETYGPNGECLEATKACTIQVSASRRQPEDPAGPQPARYWGASTNGSKVLFTSNAELTADAYTGPSDEAANLYEYDLTSGELTDLTVDDADVAEGADVQGVVQISEHGSYVYFVAKGVLKGAHGEPLQNVSDAEPLAGGYNLYVSHKGEPAFIATLGAEDVKDWLGENFKNIESQKAYHTTPGNPEMNTAVVTPSGTQLAFASKQTLTAYDNQQADTGACSPEAGAACSEIYQYNAETGTLGCASCNPTGARPVGGATVPDLTNFRETYRPRDVLADGRLFFESTDTLASGATAGQQNVYEYEDGHIHPISHLGGTDKSFFLDASPNGQNVFLATAEQLLPQDEGDSVVVWDAREDGGYPVPTTPQRCDNAASCQSAPASQPAVYSSGGTGAFSGPGDIKPSPPPPPKPWTAAQLRAEKLAKALKACRARRNRHNRQVCEKQARKKYGAKASARKSATRAIKDRRAK